MLLVGKRIARTLEILNWVLVACILGSFLVLGLIYVPIGTWFSALAGFTGFDTARGAFNFLPENLDILLLGALVGYSGGGGVLNLTLSNWARDKGYGMGSRVGHIAGAVGGEKVHLADTGFMFEAGRGQPGALARLVAHRARRPVGHLLRRRLVRHDAAGAAVRDVRRAGHRHQGPGHQRRAGADHRRHRRALAGRGRRVPRRVDPVQDPARLRGRHDALDHRHPVDRQRARARAGAAAMCARCTTRCWPRSWSGESSRSSSRRR